MRTSEAGIDLIKAFEGRFNRPYMCPAVLWSVGYGRVLYPDQVRLKVPERKAYPLRSEHNRAFDDDEIDSYLIEDIRRVEIGVLRLCPAAADNQCHFDALTSFAFNCGLGALQRSTLRMKYNRGDYEGAANEFLKWTKANGKTLAGLVRRRNAERTLFLAGD